VSDFHDFELLAVELLLVASVVAIAVHYIRLPYTVALVVVGLLFSFANVFDVSLSRELILLVFVPPLLFDGAINMDLPELRRRWGELALLTVGGTLVTAAMVAAALVALTGMPLKYAVVLAVMLAPTDPVSVLATMKEHGVPSGLRTLLEGESIFNDALGIVLFTIAMSAAFPAAANDAFGWQSATREFATEVGVGSAVGLAAGFGIHRLMRLVDDHLVEITLSLAFAYGSFLVADRLGGSGVTAVVAGGLLLGNYGTSRAMSDRSQAALIDFWEIVAFLLNSALFLLIGLAFEARSLGEGPIVAAIVVTVAALLLGRAVGVYGLLLRFGGGRRVSAAVPLSWRHAIAWGGLRGSIPIALALGLTQAQRDFAGIDPVAVVFATVLVSLVAQGATFAPLLGRLRVSTGSPAAQ
jgi:CPA1 family monovalent cation:H+ antiporter